MLYRLTIFVLLIILLSGCLGKKYLKENEYILRKQKIGGNQAVDKSDLRRFYRQTPNRVFPIPYVALYYWGLENYDEEKLKKKKNKVSEKFDTKINSKKDNEKAIARLKRRKKRKIAKIDKSIEEGNLLMRIGEPLAVFDSTLSSETAEQMNLYLHSKGFFDASTKYEVRYKNRKAKVTYIIEENTPYKIDSIYYKIQDPAIDTLVEKEKEDKIIEIGQNYDEEKLAEERVRIETLLKNNGYYKFNRQFIRYEVDTTARNLHVFIRLIIENPPEKEKHPVFTVDSVNFVVDYDPNINNSQRDSAYYKGNKYLFIKNHYPQRILDRRVFIYPNTLYSRNKTYETQRQLANLDMFKFVDVRYDTLGTSLIGNIHTKPLDRFQAGTEIGMNVTQGLPGPYINLSLKNRNFFRGLEVTEISATAAIEGVTAATDLGKVYQSQELNLNLSLTFPQFIAPIGNRLKNKFGDLNPKTKSTAGYSYTKRPEYTRRAGKASQTYTWQNKEKFYYNYTLSDISIINSDLSAEFSQRLDELAQSGNNLRNAFNSALVSSSNFFTIINFNRYGSYSTREKSAYLKLYGELGGNIWNIINPDIVQNIGLEHYKFYKINIDYRQYVPIRPNRTTTALRLNLGFANAYADNGVLPYEKYFFAGGSNSIKAWRPRRLGPGSYTPQLNENPEEEGVFDYRFEQPGEILLEASFEIRQKIFSILEGALFADAGNIWTVNEDPSREGANFEFNRFYKEIALGVGVGLRFDFSFLILRFDVGMKVYDPAREEGQRWLLRSLSFKRPFGEKEQTLINIGIGYPF